YAELRGAFELVESMCVSSVPLLLDHEGAINREYSLHMEEMKVGKKLLVQLLKRNVHFASGKRNASCEAPLAAQQFDPSDLPYVGVAQNCGGFYLTHEEKHLDSLRRDLVATACGVQTVGSADLPLEF
ncbi:MAG TPA: hypothetical protein VGE78_00680, partial [Agromyces sp.]